MTKVIPTDMRAIDPTKPGGADVLTIVRRPVPTPGVGEVLIEVAAGVNRPDIIQRMGHYPPPPGAPTILGLQVHARLSAPVASWGRTSWSASRCVRWWLAVAKELVWPHVAAGILKPCIDETFPLECAADAHLRMEAGDPIGKIVLIVR